MKSLYHRDNSIVERYCAKIDRILAQVGSDKRLCFFGYSSAGIVAVSYIRKHYPERSVIGFVDNNSRVYVLGDRDGREAYAIRPVNTLAGRDGDTAVLIASAHYNSMAQELQQMGFVEGESFFLISDLSEEQNAFDFVDRTGYEEISMRENKLLQFQMLRYLRSVCDVHDIPYYIAYGTLLGAVRDQGIIPWDDDVDVCVRGEDLARLMEIINAEGRYQLLHYDNDPDYCFDLAVLVNPRFIQDRNLFPLVFSCGVTLDIYPLWEQPDDDEKEDFILEYRRLEAAIYEEIAENGTTRKSMGERERFLRSFRGKKENYGLMHYAYQPEVKKRVWFEDTALVTLEGESFKAPIGYEEVLRHGYGPNFMQPPPSSGGGRIMHRARFYVARDPELIGDGRLLEEDRAYLRTTRLRYDSYWDAEEDTIVIPEEWEQTVTKPDGSRRKVILFDAGSGSVIHYGDRMIAKIRDCMEVFSENGADIAVLWHTRGQSVEMLRDISPSLADSYREAVERFLRTDFGIYDDSTDDARAIRFCDAYYGDGGALAQKCRDAGKPVMIQNIDILSST